MHTQPLLVAQCERRLDAEASKGREPGADEYHAEEQADYRFEVTRAAIARPSRRRADS